MKVIVRFGYDKYAVGTIRWADKFASALQIPALDLNGWFI